MVGALEEKGAQAVLSQRTGADVTAISSQPRENTGGVAPSGEWCVVRVAMEIMCVCESSSEPL